jgi:hypothetical protein
MARKRASIINQPLAHLANALTIGGMEMRKLRLIGFVMALGLLAFSSQQIRLASAQDDKMKDKGKMKGKTVHTMTIKMTGGAEAPGPGDKDGSGTAKITMNHDKGEVCYTLTTKKIQAVTAAHIHSGAAGQSGPPKITFDPPTKGCASVDKALLDEIMQTPGNFYVNVHNAEFPNGALRGQLGK